MTIQSKQRSENCLPLRDDFLAIDPLMNHGLSKITYKLQTNLWKPPFEITVDN